MQAFTFNQRVKNLYKSYFSTYENISISLDEDQIKIYLIDDQNLDSASLELIKFKQYHQITFWDGYSQSEVIETFNEKESSKTLKRFMKKLLKILNR
jgi:RNA recognition motif-containing protein